VSAVGVGDVRGRIALDRQRVLSVAAAGAGAAVLAGPLTVLAPGMAVVLVASAAVIALVAMFPPLGAYLVVALTPLVTGMDRGSVIPVLRPSEAVAGLVIGGLVVRAMVEVARGAPLRIRATGLDRALIAFAVAGSVLPVLWMGARGRDMTGDDVLFALLPWKYVAVFLIIRVTIRREVEVRRCLAISLAAACIVGAVAILQSLDLFGVSGLLSLYAPDQDVSELDAARGSSTLGSSLAVADVMVYSMALSIAWAVAADRHRGALLAVATLCLFGTVASGQYSGFLAIPVAILVLGVITDRLWRFSVWLVCALPLAAVALWPVISNRLQAFDSNTGLPASWIGRLDNLNDFFWPQLANFNWVLGVRPAARLPAPETWRDWVWIESGHTWLLWSGGIPLLVAFFVFSWVALKTTAHVARSRTDAIGVAAAAAFTALCVMSLLMIIDPHVTLRGSADLLFSLIALSLVGWRGFGAGGAREGPGRRPR
jgi:hypothetical protein